MRSLREGSSSCVSHVLGEDRISCRGGERLLGGRRWGGGPTNAANSRKTKKKSPDSSAGTRRFIPFLQRKRGQCREVSKDLEAYRRRSCRGGMERKRIQSTLG